MPRNNPVDPGNDVIDSRDVIARIETLEEIEERDEEEEGELAILLDLAEQGEASEDWSHGVTMIRDSHFKEYAQEYAEDTGSISGFEEWPLNCIDWDHAARELQYGFFAVDFDGVTFWIMN